MSKPFSTLTKRSGVAAVCLGMLLSGVLSAQVIDRSIETETRITRNAAQAQAQIDQVADETEQLVDEYRRILGETESLRIYNEQMQTIVDSQEEEVVSINDQLDGLEQTRRDVVPLMIDMAESLVDLVDADMPFRVDERRGRAESLVEMLDRSDVTIAEKYRRIMEAYQDEVEFGRDPDTYRGELPDGQQVDFLRVGRTLLFYQSLDGTQTGWWNPESREFERLPDKYRLPVRDGLAIARNQVAPDLVRLPVPAPKPARPAGQESQ